MRQNDWLSIPNILSYIRILLIPIFVHVYLSATELSQFYMAAGILALSGVTDGLDGLIARKFNQITEIGKLLDPIADKLTQVAVAATLMIRWPYMWVLVLLFTLKEGNLLINNIRLYRRGWKMDGSKWYGKIATVVFYICMFMLVVFPYLSHIYTIIMIVVTGSFQIVAFVGYAGLFLQMYKKAAK